MTRIITIFFLLLSTSLVAQNCQPDTTLMGPGFVPLILPDAQAGEPYNETITIRTIKDTNTFFNNIPVLASFDSILLLEVRGLPTGFTFNCSRPNCSFVPDTGRCVSLSGNPTQDDVGYYPLTFFVRAYVKVFGSLNVEQIDTLSIYTLVVDGGGLSTIQKNAENQILVYPNPATHNIEVSAGQMKIQYIKILNLSGQLVLKQEFEEGAKIELNVESLSSGSYIVSVSGEEGEINRKLLISR